MGSGGGGGGGISKIAGGGRTTSEKRTTLPIEQKEAFELYGSYMSTILNQNLRDNLTEEEAQQLTLVRNLDAALNSLPAREGTSYRVMSFKDNGARNGFAEQFVEGEKVTFKEYLSTSKVKNAEGFSYKEHISSTNVRLTIRGKSGRDISKYVPAKDQKEVLFGRNKRFEVVSVKENTNNDIMNYNRAVDIVLKEI